MPFTLNCFNCSTELTFEVPRVGRGEECPKCRVDIRVCYNCKNYDKNSYNECHEPQAERVLEKNKANFCDYFTFRSGEFANLKHDANEQLKKLDDLFKK